MTDELLDNIEDCPNCGKTISIGALMCEHCEKNVHNNDKSSEAIFELQSKWEDKRKAIFQARNILFILSIYIISYTFVKFKLDNFISYQNILIGGLYAILGMITPKFSQITFLTALLVYIGSIIANFVLYGFDFVATGVFVHLIVIVFLSWGVKNAFELQHIKRKLYGK